MAVLTYQNIGFAGANVTLAAADAGNDFVVPDDRGFFLVRNASGSPITATVAVAGTSEWGQAFADSPVTVPAGGERFIGPLPAGLTGAETFGLVIVAYSSVTSVSVAAVRLGPVMPGLPT